MAALRACTSITVRMYAERKKWALQNVRVELSHARDHAQDSIESDQKPTMIDRIEMTIARLGELTEDQRRGLIEIAGKCPVHRSLVSSAQIHMQEATRVKT